MLDFTSYFLRSRWRFVALSSVLALIGLSVVGVSRLSIESDIDKLFRTPDPTLDEFKQRFALTDDDIFVLLQSPRDLLQPSVLRMIREVQADISDLGPVRETISLLSLRSKRRAGRYLLPVLSSASMTESRWPASRETVLKHPLAVGHLISSDQRTTVIVVRVKPEHEEASRVLSLATQIEEIVDRRLPEADPQLELRRTVSGYAPFHAEMYVLMKRDQRMFIVGGIVLGSLIGLWLFRNVTCVFILNASSVGVVMTLGAMGLLEIPITVMNTVIPVIVIIVGFADAVHLLMEIRRRLEVDAQSGPRDRVCRWTSLASMPAHVGDHRDWIRLAGSIGSRRGPRVRFVDSIWMHREFLCHPANCACLGQLLARPNSVS